MRGHLANRDDFSLLIQEDALIIGPWGVVARLIPNAITQKVNNDAAFYPATYTATSRNEVLSFIRVR